MAPSPYRENAATPVARRATWWSTRRAVDVATLLAAAGAVASFALHATSFHSRLTLADPKTSPPTTLGRATIDPEEPKRPGLVAGSLPSRAWAAGEEAPLLSVSPLTAAQIEPVVVSNFVALREACWTPADPVHIKVRIQTRADGSVSYVEVPEVQWSGGEGLPSDERFARCVEHEIGQWTFPPSAEGWSAFATQMTFGDYGGAPRLKSLPY